MDEEPDYEVSIGTPNGTRAHYTIYVKGKAEGDSDTFEEDDRIEDGFKAIGEVWGSWDTIKVLGQIAKIDAPEDVQYKFNGQPVSKQELLDFVPERQGGDGEIKKEGDSDPGRGTLLAIEGVHGGTPYTLQARKVEKSKGHGGEANESDKLDNNVASGRVGGGTDTWEYWGPRSLDIDEPDKARIFLKTSESDSWKELTDDYRKYNGDGGGNEKSTGGGSGGDNDSAPTNRTDTDYDGENNRSGGLSLEDVIVTPGNVQEQLDEIAQQSGNAPGHERASYARFMPGATFDFGETVTIPREMIINARGANLVPSFSYDCFRFDFGAQIHGLKTNLREVKNGYFDATVFIINPVDVTYDPDGSTDRNQGYANAYRNAWAARDGDPHNKFRFLEHTRQNHFGNGMGVYGGVTLGAWADESTLFRFENDQDDDGWKKSSIALVECQHVSRGVAYPVDIVNNGSVGFINNIEVKGEFSGWRVGVTIRGEETVRKNRISGDFQPQEGISEHMLLIDNPTAQRNYLTGCTWDPQKVDDSDEAIMIRRSTGENVVNSMTGHGNGILTDETNDPTNKVVNPF